MVPSAWNKGKGDAYVTSRRGDHRREDTIRALREREKPHHPDNATSRERKKKEISGRSERGGEDACKKSTRSNMVVGRKKPRHIAFAEKIKNGARAKSYTPLYGLQSTGLHREGKKAKHKFFFGGESTDHYDGGRRRRDRPVAPPTKTNQTLPKAPPEKRRRQRTKGPTTDERNHEKGGKPPPRKEGTSPKLLPTEGEDEGRGN